jgi:hypothetical protein
MQLPAKNSRKNRKSTLWYRSRARRFDKLGSHSDRDDSGRCILSLAFRTHVSHSDGKNIVCDAGTGFVQYAACLRRLFGLTLRLFNLLFDVGFQDTLGC